MKSIKQRKGFCGLYISKTGINPQKGNRKRIVKRGFAKEQAAKKSFGG
jgi:hypothetical protein